MIPYPARWAAKRWLIAPVVHAVPMLSIRTEPTSPPPAPRRLTPACAANELDLLPLDAPIDYAVELKFDGLAISLRYRRRRAHPGRHPWRRRHRRGRHQNIRTIGQIPLRLNGAAPALLEVRGEVYMRRDHFEALNQSACAGAR